MKHLIKLCVYTFSIKPTVKTFHKLDKVYDLEKIFKAKHIPLALKGYIFDYEDNYRALMIPIHNLSIIKKYFPKYYNSKPIRLRKMLKLAKTKYSNFIK